MFLSVSLVNGAADISTTSTTFIMYRRRAKRPLVMVFSRSRQVSTRTETFPSWLPALPTSETHSDKGEILINLFFFRLPVATCSRAQKLLNYEFLRCSWYSRKQKASLDTLRKTGTAVRWRCYIRIPISSSFIHLLKFFCSDENSSSFRVF